MSTKILEITIEELKLSERSYKCLKRAGYNTVIQLMNVTEQELLKVRNLGKKSCAEVVMKLASLGLALKPEEPLHIPIAYNVLDDDDVLEEYIEEDDSFDDLDDEYDLSSPIAFSESNFSLCNRSDCEFREVCSLDETYCVKKHFDSIFSTLTPREEIVIRLSFGIDCDRQKTFDEIGAILGIPRERVRQIEAKSLRKLRQKDINKLVKALFPTIFSTTQETPYSNLTRAIFGLRGSNKELLQIEVLHPLQKERIDNAGFDEIPKIIPTH